MTPFPCDARGVTSSCTHCSDRKRLVTKHRRGNLSFPREVCCSLLSYAASTAGLARNRKKSEVGWRRYLDRPFYHRVSRVRHAVILPTRRRQNDPEIDRSPKNIHREQLSSSKVQRFLSA